MIRKSIGLFALSLVVLTTACKQESAADKITDADIKNFSGISGDKNPVHMSDEYAEKSKFKKFLCLHNK